MTPVPGRMAVSGGFLSYDIAGEGPDVVLLHGFSVDRRSWDPQIESLAKSYRVIRYDLRGFGASSLPDGAYEHGADLVELMHHLGIANSVLVGLSLGANVALSFATHRPEMLRGLVLASPGLPGYVWRTERPPDAVAKVAAASGTVAAKAFWLSHQLLASLDSEPEMRSLVHQMVHDYSGWHWEGEGRQASIAPALVALEDLKLPTLIISGGRDLEGYRDIARHINSRLPSAVLHALPAGGHFVNMDTAARDFTALLSEFSADPTTFVNDRRKDAP